MCDFRRVKPEIVVLTAGRVYRQKAVSSITELNLGIMIVDETVVDNLTNGLDLHAQQWASPRINTPPLEGVAALPVIPETTPQSSYPFGITVPRGAPHAGGISWLSAALKGPAISGESSVHVMAPWTLAALLLATR